MALISYPFPHRVNVVVGGMRHLCVEKSTLRATDACLGVQPVTEVHGAGSVVAQPWVPMPRGPVWPRVSAFQEKPGSSVLCDSSVFKDSDYFEMFWGHTNLAATFGQKAASCWVFAEVAPALPTQHPVQLARQDELVFRFNPFVPSDVTKAALCA